MFYLLRFLYLYVWIHRVCLSIFCCLLSSNIFLIYHNYFCVQAVSVMGRGEPVYSASPVAGLYDARTLQLAGGLERAGAEELLRRLRPRRWR